MGLGGGKKTYRTLSKQPVLFCVERRKAWRLLQSKPGIQYVEYLAQRALLAKMDAREPSREDVLANGRALHEAEMQALKA